VTASRRHVHYPPRVRFPATHKTKEIPVTSTSTVEIFVAAYGTEDGAVSPAKDFEAAEREGAIDLSTRQ